MPVGYLLRTSNGSLYLFENHITISPGTRLDSTEAAKWKAKLSGDAGWLESLDSVNEENEVKTIGQLFEVEYSLEDDDSVVPISGNGNFRG